MADTTTADQLMQRALALGETARRRTAPNPWVGCVIVADGEIIAQGATEPPGGPHAEVVALAIAGEAARGATAYVTLEPCSHEGRTSPCADALVAAGVARVVVAIEDPDPRVRGEGIARLRAAGIDVEIGPGADAVTQVLAPYLHHRRTGRASCLVKTAASLDGRVAAADGSSRWITGEAARADAHELRADSQAVIVGAGTALTDRPSLTVRLAADPDANRAEHQPLRVLLDARGRVPAEGPLFDTALAPTLALTTSAVSPVVVDAWQAAGAKVEVVGPASDGLGVDLASVLALLGRDGVLQAMVEGGPTLHGALLRAGLVDRIVAYVAGAALGAGGRPVFDGPSPAALVEAPRFELLDARVLAGDVRLEYSAPHSDADLGGSA